MDPETSLSDARTARDNLIEQIDSDDPSSSAIEAEGHALAEAFTALDEWLSRDGYLPEAWKADEDKTPAVEPRTGDMAMGQALSYGIFAINTLMHPDASAAADIDDLEAHADEVVEALFELRQIYKQTKAV